MTTDVITQAERYRDAILAVGVRAVLDARDVNPPAVLIRPATLNYRFGRGCVSAEWAAWLYLPDAGQWDAIKIGMPILDKVHDALATAGVAVTTATPADFQPPDGSILPGFIITWNS